MVVTHRGTTVHPLPQKKFIKADYAKGLKKNNNNNKKVTNGLHSWHIPSVIC